MAPLPARECGGCTICCAVLPIASEQFDKQAGVLCTHCNEAAGCRIYETRPGPCRAFLCGWRELALIPDDLRPDRSGILVVAGEDEAPPGYRQMPGVKFVILGGKASLEAASFLECLAGLIDARAPTYLGVPGPPGHFFTSTFLNVRLSDAVSRRDGGAMIRLLGEIMDALAGGAFEPVIFPPRRS